MSGQPRPLGMLGPLSAIAGVALALLWATGALCALLWHRQLPEATAADMLTIAVRLAADPHHPAAAWPAADRHLLPGAAGFYLTMLSLLAFAGAIAAIAVRAAGRMRGWFATDNGQEARWATRRDLADLVVRPGRCPPGRIMLGTTPWRRWIATPPRHSLLVFGPTLSGKTESFVIPTILRWRGPVIATSSKVDMLRATMDPRARRGHVLLLDPFSASGLPSIRWSPLVGATTWASAMDMAFWLTHAGSVSHSVQNAEFWETLARNLLAPLLYAAANTPGATMLNVVAWANEHDLADEVFAALDRLQQQHPTDPGPRLARSALWAAANADPRRKDSIYGTAQVLLDVYKHPAVAATASGCDIDRDAFLQAFDPAGNPTDNTVFVYAPEHRQDQLRPLFEAFICWLIRAVEDRYATTGTALDPPLLVILDEAFDMAPLRKLPTYASVLASQGVQLVAVFQNLGQIKVRYGPEASTILTNFLTKVLMGATTDGDLLDLLTHLTGKHDHPRTSTTHTADGTHTTTIAPHSRDLLPAHTLAQQPRGHALALLNQRPPIQLRVRQYMKQRDLHARL